jgi:dihydrodipicolinate synthase/N-acetylneuraminate lyase
VSKARLTAKTLHGIWSATKMTWDAKFRFDETAYAQNIRRTIAAKVHGIYTTGSTGEFYAIDDDEFRRMVDIQAELCGGAKMPLQIGCCTDATHKTLRQLEYAATKKAVGAAQVALPYWMELTDCEVVQFFKDLHSACPDLPLVHYNIPRAKRFLTGSDYLRILDVAPNLIGVKYTFLGSNFSAFQTTLEQVPTLAFFVSETLLASAMQLGAKGSCSALIDTNPKFMLDMYKKIQAGKWADAIKMQRRAAAFVKDAVAFVQSRNEGFIDPVIDKGFAVASGFMIGHQRCRAPYIGWSDETIVAFRKWLEKNYPDFIYPK